MVSEYITWSPGITLDEIEKQVILKAFRFYRGNKTTTSHALGISIRTLDNKLERYQNEEKVQKDADDKARIERERFLQRQRGDVQTSPKTGSNILGPIKGVSMESPVEVAAEQQMPMPKRAQVQTVLPTQATKSSAGRRG